MAAVVTGQSTPGRARRIKTITAFASKLRERLLKDPLGATFDNRLQDDVRSHIRSLHLISHGGSHSEPGDREIDQVGSSLWNQCTRLRQEWDSQPPLEYGPKLLPLSRVLAFHLLDTAQRTESSGSPSLIRLLRLALKTSKNCIEISEIDIATTVLQKAADYNGRLHGPTTSLPPEHEKDAKGLETEYFFLRALLAWKENRLDLAEHMYNNGNHSPESLEPYQAEKLADLLYELGRDLLSKKDFPTAIQWLSRSIGVIDGQKPERLTREAVELRTAISQALITASLGNGATEDLERADSIVGKLESEMGNELVVLLLRLEILQKSPEGIFDTSAYAHILGRMIKGFDFTDSTFKIILYHIRVLHDKSPELGSSLLDGLIKAVRKAEANDEWIDRLVVTRIRMTTERDSSPGTLQSVQDILTSLTGPLSTDAAVAAQTLLWNKIEPTYTLGQFELAERWCRLGLHDAFQNSGPGNTAKLERKLLLCAITKNDLEGARSIFNTSAENTQKETKTMYLMYKVATRSGDHDLAARYLEALSLAPRCHDYLYACVVDSQQAGNKICAIEALEKLIKSYDYSSPNPVHLPALFRCTIRLLRSVLDSEGEQPNQVGNAERLCDLFDTVTAAAGREPRDPRGNKLFTNEELDWFARNSYNLGLTHVGSWEPRHCVQILTACTNIISLFNSSAATETAEDMSFKLLFSNFVIASALVSQARSRQESELLLQDYSLVRRHVAEFEKELPGRLESLRGKAREDLLKKLATMLAFDFEAAITLNIWQDLCSIIRKAGQCKSIAAFQAMGDSLLRSGVEIQELYAPMKAVINEIWRLEKFRAANLAKYMRCLLQVTLVRDDDLGLELVAEFCQWACEASKSTTPIPAGELEWLATTAFNRGVDCYTVGQGERCKRWVSRSLDLAQHVNDGGVLGGILREKRRSLRIDTS